MVRAALYGVGLSCIGRRLDNDDALFELATGADAFAVVHLTWSGKREIDPRWPSTALFRTWDAFCANRMDPDAADDSSE